MNRYEDETDARLVMLTLDGDGGAFEQVVLRCQRPVFAAVREIVSDAFAVEDIAQETFIDAYMNLLSLREPDKLRPWLVGIARRKSLRYVTRRRRFEDIESAASFNDPDDDPELSFLRYEKNARVRAEVLSLPDKMRQAAVMFYFHDMSVVDIAKSLGVPRGTVARRLHDARAKLKERLGYMNENIKGNKDNIVPEGFAAEVKKRLLEIQTYYVESGFSKDEKLTKMYDDAEKYIETAPSEHEKKSALADLYTFWGMSPEKESEGLALAKETGNGVVLADRMIDELLKVDDCSEQLKRLDGEMIPEMERLGCGEGKGELLFWRARAMVELKKPIDELERTFAEAARLIPPENVYQACAVCALRTIAFMREHSSDPYSGIHVVSEQYRASGGKLLFISEPGFSSDNVAWYTHRWDAITYYASRGNRVFYDISMKPGDIVTDDKGGTLLLVSYSEALTVPAGAFGKCMHISRRVTKEDSFSAEVWYADGVGLVKAVFSDGTNTEDYELSEYEHKGGDGWFPLAVGNMWRYTSSTLPDYVAPFYELYVTWTDGVSSNLSVATTVTKKKDFDEKRDADSAYFIDKCDELCGEGSTDIEKVYEAIEALRQALRRNTSERDTVTALGGIDYLERFADYMKKYRLCPSSFNTSLLTRRDGRVTEKDFYYSFGPYRWGTHHNEDRIFGAKPYRYQENFFGCIWDDKWTVGYHEEDAERRHPYKRNGETHRFTFDVIDGGTVTVPAGTFDDCLKLTIEYGAPDEVPTEYFVGTGGSVMGKKEYWLARGVGIVRFDCDWGGTLNSSLRLTSYKNPAREGGYFPLAIGCEWEYDEAVLTSQGYCAKRVTKIPCGHGGSFLLLHSQEFYYLGTDAEYDAFIAGLADAK